MKTASYLLKSKLDQTVFTIAPTSSVFEAVQLMVDKNIGALLVTQGEQVVGIFSERDCARKVTLR
ncbi:MAG TPA: CBS domain-containing protein, partial [Burkholderiaceae bacterium]|nr:CBS domain-containing protein [Burkholderiaceae bacterium]